MTSRACLLAPILLLPLALPAQILTLPNSPNGSLTASSNSALNLIQTTIMDTNFALINGLNQSPLQNPNVALSQLDLKAPGKAQREYAKGYQLLSEKKLSEAVNHLRVATDLYPSYVAAHNALGSAYMGLGQNDEARAEFALSASLDDHLPNSFLNLGCAELALKDYAEAEKEHRESLYDGASRPSTADRCRLRPVYEP
jgi:Flp pilus assembly protein TadD